MVTPALRQRPAPALGDCGASWRHPGPLAVGRRIIHTMSLKSAAFFAFIGMALLTILLAVGFIRDVSALLAGAIAAVVLLTSLIHLLASLSLAVFLYVFHKGQG